MKIWRGWNKEYFWIADSILKTKAGKIEEQIVVSLNGDILNIYDYYDFKGKVPKTVSIQGSCILPDC